MADPLSQADIDMLLNTFSEGGAAAGEPAAGGDGPGSGRSTRPTREARAESYDFSHPDLLSPDQVRTLGTVHEGYAQALAERLSSEFLSSVSASVCSIDTLTYAEFLMLLPQPTVLAVIEVPQLEGGMAVELSPAVAFAFIDRLLGGEGMPIREIRPLTAIEQGLMEQVFRQCCEELAGAWAPIHAMDFHLRTIEGNPEFARVVAPSEMVVLVSLELRINDVSGKMNLCLPHHVMEPAIQRLCQGPGVLRRSGSAPAGPRGALRESIAGARLAIDVDLGRTTLTLRELMDLEPGDVLRFRSASPSGVEARVEDTPRLDGSAGRSHGFYAMRVERRTTRNDSPSGEGGGT